MSKKLKFVLIISLFLNVLFLGTLVSFESERFTKKPENNSYFFKEMKSFYKANAPKKQALRKERKIALDMVITGPYDQAKYISQIDKINDLQAKLFKDMTLRMAEVLQGMDVKERQAIQKRLERHFGYKKPHHKR